MATPGPTAMKNMMVPGTAAAADLGLGDQLKTQLQIQLDERKKKLMSAGGGAPLLPATSELFGLGG